MSLRIRSLRLFLLIASALALILFRVRTEAPPPASAHYAFGHGPTIVLVHGLGSRSGHWLAVARRLAQHHRVVLVDLPGHGDTEMLEPFSLDRAELALDRALATEPGPVVLVGHSVGGLIAAAEAIDHPSRVRALVLVESPLRQPFDAHERAELLVALDHDYRDVIRAAYESFGRDSAQGRKLWLEANQIDSLNMRSWIRLAVLTDLSARGAALRMPVLAVMAERSWAVGQPWPVARDAMGYSSIPNLTPLRLTGCGHFIMLDRPDALADAIEKFADGAVAVQPVAAR